jgi:anthranilate phosphoribosyltransferase
VLEGRERGPRAEHVALNAGAGFRVAGRVDGLEQGVARAREILASGAAALLLERYARESQARREAA